MMSEAIYVPWCVRIHSKDLMNSEDLLLSGTLGSPLYCCLCPVHRGIFHCPLAQGFVSHMLHFFDPLQTGRLRFACSPAITNGGLFSFFSFCSLIFYLERHRGDWGQSKSPTRHRPSVPGAGEQWMSKRPTCGNQSPGFELQLCWYLWDPRKSPFFPWASVSPSLERGIWIRWSIFLIL